jgi:hypothetical protein
VRRAQIKFRKLERNWDHRALDAVPRHAQATYTRCHQAHMVTCLLIDPKQLIAVLGQVGLLAPVSSAQLIWQQLHPRWGLHVENFVPVSWGACNSVAGGSQLAR